MIATNQFTANSIVKHLEGKYPEINWNERKVSKIVRNKIYLGVFENKRITVENHSPVIIDEELFNLTNNIMDGRSKNAKYTYIFRERVLCVDCNHPMKAEPGTSMNSTMYYYYHCTKCNSRISEIKLQEMLKYELNQYARRYFRDKEINDVNNNLTAVKKQLNQAYKENANELIGKLSRDILELEEKRDQAMLMGTKLWGQLDTLQKIGVLEKLNLDVIYFASKKQGYIIARL